MKISKLQKLIDINKLLLTITRLVKINKLKEWLQSKAIYVKNKVILIWENH